MDVNSIKLREALIERMQRQFDSDFLK